MHICDMGKLIILHFFNIWIYQITNWFTENKPSAIRAFEATCSIYVGLTNEPIPFH